MSAFSLFFVFLGIGFATANLMKLISYLDQPHGRTGRARIR